MRFWIILFVALVVLNLVVTFYSTCHAMECKEVTIDKIRVLKKSEDRTWTGPLFEEHFKIDDEYEIKGYSCTTGRTCSVLLCKEDKL